MDRLNKYERSRPKLERDMMLVTMLREGYDPYEIARQFNINRSGVSRIAKKRTGKTPTQIQKENGHHE